MRPQAVSTCTLTYSRDGRAAARICATTALAMTTRARYTESGAIARMRFDSATRPR